MESPAEVWAAFVQLLAFARNATDPASLSTERELRALIESACPQLALEAKEEVVSFWQTGARPTPSPNAFQVRMFHANFCSQLKPLPLTEVLPQPQPGQPIAAFQPVALESAAATLPIPRCRLILRACSEASAALSSAAGNPSCRLLTKDQIAAVLFYGFNDEVPRRMNDCILSRSPAIAEWRAFLRVFLGAVRSLPLICGVVYRGVPSTVDTSDAYAKGRRVVWNSFSSCSRSPELPKKFMSSDGMWQGTFFTIRVKTGRSLAGVSAGSGGSSDEEVILEPGCEFIVNNVVDLGYVVQVEMSQCDSPTLYLAPVAPPLSVLSPPASTAWTRSAPPTPVGSPTVPSGQSQAPKSPHRKSTPRSPSPYGSAWWKPVVQTLPPALPVERRNKKFKMFLSAVPLWAAARASMSVDSNGCVAFTKPRSVSRPTYVVPKSPRRHKDSSFRRTLSHKSPFSSPQASPPIGPHPTGSPAPFTIDGSPRLSTGSPPAVSITEIAAARQDREARRLSMHVKGSPI